MRKSTAGAGTTQQYLGVDEAGVMTGMSAWFWRRKAYNGTVSSVKFGRRLLIPRAEIERFIHENTRPRVPGSVAETKPATEEPSEAR
jgi:excisionase family DNA binding protein